MVIKQGDVYWVNLGPPEGSEPGYRHPLVVIQNDVFNQSNINTVVACAITSNLKWAKAPGNVHLSKGEANLPKESVINVTQLQTIDRRKLKEKIGKLSSEIVEKIIEGLNLVLEP